MEKKIETQVCIECGRELPITEFRKTTKGNYFHACNRCVSTKRLKTIDARKHAPYIDMSKFPDDTLLAELKKRGYTGSLNFSKTVAV